MPGARPVSPSALCACAGRIILLERHARLVPKHAPCALLSQRHAPVHAEHANGCTLLSAGAPGGVSRRALEVIGFALKRDPVLRRGRGAAPALPQAVLPRMRGFTFLRLTPEMLSPPYAATWARFVARMRGDGDGVGGSGGAGGGAAPPTGLDAGPGPAGGGGAPPPPRGGRAPAAPPPAAARRPTAASAASWTPRRACTRPPRARTAARACLWPTRRARWCPWRRCRLAAGAPRRRPPTPPASTLAEQGGAAAPGGVRLAGRVLFPGCGRVRGGYRRVCVSVCVWFFFTLPPLAEVQRASWRRGGCARLGPAGAACCPRTTAPQSTGRSPRGWTSLGIIRRRGRRAHGKL